MLLWSFERFFLWRSPGSQEMSIPWFCSDVHRSCPASFSIRCSADDCWPYCLVSLDPSFRIRFKSDDSFEWLGERIQHSYDASLGGRTRPSYFSRSTRCYSGKPYCVRYRCCLLFQYRTILHQWTSAMEDPNRRSGSVHSGASFLGLQFARIFTLAHQAYVLLYQSQ